MSGVIHHPRRKIYPPSIITRRRCVADYLGSNLVALFNPYDIQYNPSNGLVGESGYEWLAHYRSKEKKHLGQSTVSERPLRCHGDTRENLLLVSNDLTTWAAGTKVTTPDAETIRETATTDFHGIRNNDVIGPLGGKKRYVSALIEPEGRDWCWIGIGNGNTNQVFFHLSGTGSVGTQGSNINDATIEASGDGYLCWMEHDNVTNVNDDVWIGTALDDLDDNFLGDVTKGLKINNAHAYYEGASPAPIVNPNTYPLFRGAPGAHPCIYAGWDGTITDWLQTAAFGADLIQPCVIAGVLRPLYQGTTQEHYWDGVDAAKRLQYRIDSGDAYEVNGGSSQDLDTQPSHNVWQRLIVRYNGALSKFWLDNNPGEAISGTVGAEAINGLTLGARYDGAANYAHLQVAEVFAAHDPGDTIIEGIQSFWGEFYKDAA